MSKKKSIILTAIITFAATVALAVPSTMLYVQHNQKDVLLDARNMIEQYYVDPLTEEQIQKMNDYAISGMVASLEDPYSYYLNEEDFMAFQRDSEEEYIGVGVNVSFNTEKNQMVVISPIDGSPAQAAGLLPGDVIVRVDDLTVTFDNYNDVVDHIRGNGAKAGSTVTIYVLRGEEELEIVVARDVIPLETVSQKMLDENVGYIRVSEFKHNTVEDFQKAMDFVSAENAKALIIDLRNNPGGYADSVLKMTDMLLPEGVIAYLENNKGEKEYFHSDANCYDIPMVILVNQGTASASELMAGSTKAYERATIIGKKTYGKAVGQTPLPLTDTTAIYLTSARYFTPKGECIDKLGIKPDIEVDLPEGFVLNLTKLDVENDTQLQKALEHLYQKIEPNS